MPYRADVDGLRAVAVLLIVFFHLRLVAVPGGFVGVDVFFVISGYLITALIAREAASGQFALGAFYMRRLRRLGPALLFTIVVTLVAGWFILPPSFYQSTAQSAAAAVFSVSNIYFWQQAGYFDTSAAFKPLLHTWSLSVEEQFYLIWPATMVAVLAMAGKRVLVALTILLGLATLVISERVLHRLPEAAFFLTPLRFFEFGIGAVLALTGWQARSAAAAQMASVAGLFSILYVSTVLTEASAFPGLNAALPAAATALIIYAGPTGSMNRVLALPPVRYIGQISYSLYLIHWPLIVFAVFLWGEAIDSRSVLILLVTILVAGAAMYHLIETPFRRSSPAGFLIPARRLGIACLTTAAAICLASLVVHQANGIPGRYPPAITALIEERRVAISERADLTREWDCNATENSAAVYLTGFARCQPETDDGIVVVLGDSHAADVYMGLRAAYPDMPLAQLTGNGCNFVARVASNRFCAPAMAEWQRWIEANADRIAAVIYHQSGASLMQRRVGGNETPDPELVDELIATLRAYTPAEAPLIVWGPRVSYRPTIDIAIAGSRARDELQDYYPSETFAAQRLLDTALATAFAATDTEYVSTITTLCARDCPVFTRAGDLFVVDHAHWSLPGAIEATTALIDASAGLQVPKDSVD